MTKTDTAADPFAAVSPVAVERLSDPKPVEINPAARDLIGKSYDSEQVLEITATDEAHLKALLKHLRAAAHDEGVRLHVKTNGLIARFKASPKTGSTAETSDVSAE